MGDERARAYLRLLAERQVRASRRAGRGTGSDLARSVEQVRWAGEILAAAGVVEESDVHRVAAELEAALLVRSDLERRLYVRRIGWALDAGADPGQAGAGQAGAGQAGAGRAGGAGAVGVAPIGRTIRVGHERVASELHLMSLVRLPGRTVITAALRAHWPRDGSCADLEITGAGPHLLPYDQLRAADDRGSPYRVMMTGEGGAVTWQGAIGLPGDLPPDARWLDLIADGTQRLIRIELNPADHQGAAAAEPAPAVSPGERLLALTAEHILASAWDEDGPRADPRLDEAITVLTGAGALAADSPLPGQLAALCQRLGVAEAGIGVRPAADLPARWAQALPPETLPPETGPPETGPPETGPPDPGAPQTGPPDPGPEWYAPLAPGVADLDGARFAVAGLATAAGQSFLHVVATGRVPPAHGPAALSWWVADEAGRWHLGTVSDPHTLEPGGAPESGAVPFRLRLTPPLRARPDRVEVVVTGRTARVRVTAPVDPDMPDT